MRPYCPKCKGSDIKWEWLKDGDIFDIYCPCGFHLNSEHVDSLSDFAQFFSGSSDLLAESEEALASGIAESVKVHVSQYFGEIPDALTDAFAELNQIVLARIRAAKEVGL